MILSRKLLIFILCFRCETKFHTHIKHHLKILSSSFKLSGPLLTLSAQGGLFISAEIKNFCSSLKMIIVSKISNIRGFPGAIESTFHIRK